MKNPWCKAFTWKALSRRRDMEEDKGEDKLSRVMGLFDLTALGVGSTLGLGVYVLAGQVAKQYSGPAVCISFLIGAIASAFAGMCYAEFAARIPKAGSAYIYSYVTVGEFIAFVIGWNLILEYVIASASMACGLSHYIDTLVNNAMENTLKSMFPIKVSYLSEYPDFFACGMILLLMLLLCVGARESSLMNNIFVFVNITTILIIVIAGSIKANPSNWFIPIQDIPAHFTQTAGAGGFMPFGFSGLMAGAATCFYGFVGFDVVATTSEEAKNPQKNIPLAIVFSLAIVFIVYFSISTVLTMMWPYYDQDLVAPFPYVFDQLGWPVISLLVNIGAVFAMCTSLLGGMFPLPRILYSMASDGIIYKCFANINSKTKTPILGTFVSGIVTAIMTLLFNLNQLINLMSIGVLLAYTIVAVSVLILRYQKSTDASKDIELETLRNGRNCVIPKPNLFVRLFNFNNETIPDAFASNVVKCGVVLFSILVLIFGGIFTHIDFHSDHVNMTLIVICCIIALILLLTMFIIGRQPSENVVLSFKVPLVPVIPCLSIFMNLYLMVQFDASTWIKYTIWMIIGFIIYFTYGIFNSEQGKKESWQKGKSMIIATHL